jgi:hypothetical protein
MDAASKPALDRLIDDAPCFGIFDHLVIENIYVLFECTVFIIIYFEINNLFSFPVIGNVLDIEVSNSLLCNITCHSKKSAVEVYVELL